MATLKQENHVRSGRLPEHGPVAENGREILLSLKNVDITFGKGDDAVRAVQDASFDIYKGETFSLVGAGELMGIAGQVLGEQAHLLDHLLHLPHPVGLVLKEVEVVQALGDDIVHGGPLVQRLDVSIRAQVLNLMKKFQEEKDLTYLFIAHDLSVVRFISDRIGVIYKGRIVEIAEAEELFNFPLHPYTHSLISAIPSSIISSTFRTRSASFSKRWKL